MAEAARDQHQLDAVVISISRAPLGKEVVERPGFDDRVGVVQAWVDGHPWLALQVTDQRLLADIAQNFDLMILGADKYHQIQDPRWYGGEAERDAAMERLGPVAVAPRPPLSVPADVALDLDPDVMAIYSSTLAREGRTDLMVPAAAEFARRTGAWEGGG